MLKWIQVKMVMFRRDEEQLLLPEFEIYNPLLSKDDITRVIRMKAKINAVIKLEDGKHTGIVQKVEYREKPYNYVDIVIKEDTTGLDLKAGYPFYISENSALGQVLMNFGMKNEIGKEVEIEDYINGGLKVSFLTQTEKTDKGNFVRIIQSSLKLVD